PFHFFSRLVSGCRTLWLFLTQARRTRPVGPACERAGPPRCDNRRPRAASPSPSFPTGVPMNVRTARPSRARPAGFRPQVEALEERTMLDASAVLVGDTLIITGTSKADHIHIVDQGNFDSSKTVTVFSHGVQKLQAPGTLVRRITFSTGLKDD